MNNSIDIKIEVFFGKQTDTTFGIGCYTKVKSMSEWISFNSLSWHDRHQGPYNPHKLCNHNLHIEITIFSHRDNQKFAGYN